jgi:TolB-like protein/DNA-binding winged helix-turn-helix (wHTH) protein/Flp pilus assembly protein TadD
MEILLLLVERRNEVVTRKEIVARVWGEDAFFDTDNSINGAIRKIRHVLRDNSEQPRYIQTITGQGYRFIAPILSVSESGISLPELSVLPSNLDVPQPSSRKEREVALQLTPTTNDTSQRAPTSNDTDEAKSSGTLTSPSRSSGARRFILIAAAAVLLGGVTATLTRFRFNEQPRSSNSRLMLAVLPFENLTGDPSQEYFSDGMTEEIITELGDIDPRDLGIIARTSVMHYKGSRVSLSQVGRELSVQYVMEGSIRRDAERVRVTAQLIQTKDQTHVWAKEYDRELKDALVLQGEVAHEIADEVQITLGSNNPALKSRSSVSPQHYQAHDLYMKGQYFFNKRTSRDLEQAISYFELAAAKDKQYAAAYAAIAACYAIKGGYSGQSQTEFMPKARSAALRALEIDDRLAEAHAALALIVQNYDWDWPTAEREFRRAIELNPNYATAHHWYAEHLMWRGRFDEALEESERARQLDPLSLIIAADNGAILFFSRQYDRAINKWRMVQQLDPQLRRAHLIEGAYVEKGMFAEAISDAKNHSEIPASRLSWSAYIYGRSGETAKAYHALSNLIELNSNHPIDPMLVAWAYLGLSDKESALAWLEKAYAQHSIELVTLKVNPGYNPLRSDPRFQRLLRRVGLAG